MNPAAVMKGERARREAALIAHLAEHPDRPIPAVELADAIGIGGCHENKRRRVREIAKRLRRPPHGQRICASSGRPEDCGLWLARNDAEWRAYKAARRRHATFEFVEVRRAERASSERSRGQGTLFDTRSAVV